MSLFPPTAARNVGKRLDLSAPGHPDLGLLFWSWTDIECEIEETARPNLPKVQAFLKRLAGNYSGVIPTLPVCCVACSARQYGTGRDPTYLRAATTEQEPKPNELPKRQPDMLRPRVAKEVEARSSRSAAERPACFA